MGIAYAVRQLTIYLLVVAQFRPYFIPIIIMAPIPLTIIGAISGYALINMFSEAQFTATSMIRMIALAGIIVSNASLVVDFFNQQVAEGIPLHGAVHPWRPCQEFCLFWMPLYLTVRPFP